MIESIEGVKKMKIKFTNIEGYIVLDTLSNLEEFFLPGSILRDILYPLMKKFFDKLGIDTKEGYSVPNLRLFDEELRGGYIIKKKGEFEVELSLAEIDYISKAIFLFSYSDIKLNPESFPRCIHKGIKALERLDEFLKGSYFEYGVAPSPENCKLMDEAFGWKREEEEGNEHTRCK
jgi:hypothetical protein